MATPPKKAPDRFYDFRKTNIWFTWSVVGLLATTVWMIADDYAKPWKRLQAEFRSLERQQLKAEAEAERQTLSQDEIAQMEADIAAQEESLAGQAADLGELEGRIDGLGKEIYKTDAAARQTKSLLDTARYEYDVALQGGKEGSIAKAKDRVDSLNTKLREEQRALEALREQEDGAKSSLATMQADRDAAVDRLEALRKGLTNLEERADRLAKGLDYFVLNAPLTDFMAPDLTVEQIVLPGLYHDINFTKIDRVDRCMTCHVAAGRPGFESEEWEEPFRSHPRLDLFLTDTSPHPYTRFGCTSCHGGLDRATDFARAGHSPQTAEQEHEWVEEWGWEEQPFLETPIVPANYSEAGCISCHAAEVWTPRSQLQDVGRQLATRMGCYACHAIEYPAFQEMPRPGPDLRRVASKDDPAWAYRWIEAPRDFHPTTFMPHFFFQENIVGELNLERQKVEIASMVAYMWDRSETVDYPEPPRGDVARGEALYNSVGCTGCHIMDADAERDQFYPDFNRMHGPNLIRTGSKVSAGWLYAWLKNPKEYAPETRMPNLRLTDQEAADLTAFLMTSRDEAFENLEMPSFDPEVRDDLALKYLENKLTIEQSVAELEVMSDEERNVYLGGQTIQKYGCYGCHELEGFDDAKPIGVELTEEGSKPVHQFDFGHRHDVPHTRQDWIYTKMREPRSWDRGKETVKTYEELYRMPNFGMSDREARAIVANVLGFTKESVVAARQAGQDARGAALAAGRKLITRYNCQGCHLIENRGHAIRTAVDDVGMLPPNLAAQGARVQSDWMFEYLHDPSSETMRPWLGVRMPTFDFTDEEANTLVAYFAARDDRTPFSSPPGEATARDSGVGEVVFGMLQCAKCHPAGPAAIVPGATSAAELAPSLLLAPERLRHDWVPSWIKEPQTWVAGTKMPANFGEPGNFSSPLVRAIDAPMFTGQKQAMMRYFDSEDELKAYLGDVDKVTGALRDHIWNLE